MNTIKNCKNALIALLLLAGLIGASELTGQETMNGSERSHPSTDLPDCEGVEWDRSLLTDYPWVTDSCHEVFAVDGQVWARFEAEFKGMNHDGTFDVAFLDRGGQFKGLVSLKPWADQAVFLNNREHEFTELRDGQMLNFYIMEGAYGFAIERLPQNVGSMSASRRARLTG